jgi:hypothetical protein
MTEWTAQDEKQLRELRRRKKAWQITQQGRKRHFGPKKYKPDISDIPKVTLAQDHTTVIPYNEKPEGEVKQYLI